MKRLISMVVVSLSVAAATVGQSPDRPLAEQGYAGLTLRDIPDGHTVISWIFPGPLQGEGLVAPKFDLARPDLVVSVNGQSVNAEQFKELVRSSSPGARIEIKYRKSNARGGTIPTELDHAQDVRTIELVLESRDVWTGTIGRARGHDRAVVFRDPPVLDPFDRENVLGAAVAQHELEEPTKKLLRVFTDWLEKGEDFHSLSRMRAGFEHPFQLSELQRLVTAPTAQVIRNPLGTAAGFAAVNIDAALPVAGNQGTLIVTRPHEGLVALDFLLGESTLVVKEALGDLWQDEALAQSCLAMLRVPRETFYVQGHATRDQVQVMRRSMDVNFDRLVSALAHFDRRIDIADELSAAEPIDLPQELAGAVDGPILAARKLQRAGWIVVGSDEANRYDMVKIAGVLDPGGDDEYYATDLRLGCRVIIDLAGNDHYTGTDEQGPGAALLGVSFIDDRTGDDRYEGKLLSTGAAMFGMSLLLDRAGNDTYIGGEWSIGAACYGAAMIFDLGNGSDTYLGDFLCEGVGGPRGFGCIVDEAGRDLYRANGPTTSAYGTPAVYQSFSQGIGFGYRNYAAGGIGLISDLAGDDRYEAGEFAQGGAYYFGLGILHDAKGRDLYYGNRYGQGFGVHQAIGVLADDQGDDTYWSMTAASQGAAWDIGVGLLIDRAGNDTYQCDGLGQGGASMQAIGVLLDLGGIDRYSAGGGATQGQSGGNSYHYHETGAFSFSALIDLGGGDDWYSRGRSNNASISTGELNDADPQNSSLHGLFIDR